MCVLYICYNCNNNTTVPSTMSSHAVAAVRFSCLHSSLGAKSGNAARCRAAVPLRRRTTQKGFITIIIIYYTYIHINPVRACECASVFYFCARTRPATSWCTCQVCVCVCVCACERVYVCVRA
jgi:hypothetical protein